MKKIVIALYQSLPFFICLLFAVLTKYTTIGSSIFDLSGVVVFGSFVFWGIILFIANLLIYKRLKSKKILSSIWVQQVTYLVAYILLCVMSNLFIKPVDSYNLVFFIPFITIAISLFLNIIIHLVKKPINHEGTFDKISLVACIILLCFSVASVTYYYVEWDSHKKWAQEREGKMVVDFTHKEDKNVDSLYIIKAVRESDEVYSVSLSETYYFNTEEEGTKIAQLLRERNAIEVTETQFVKAGYSRSYNIKYSLGGISEPKLTEASLNKFNPLIHGVTVNNKVSYSKLLKLLCDNGFSSRPIT